MSDTSQACPNCGAVVDTAQGFGMVPCSQCGHMVLIGTGTLSDPLEAPTASENDPVSFDGEIQEPISQVEPLQFDEEPSWTPKGATTTAEKSETAEQPEEVSEPSKVDLEAPPQVDVTFDDVAEFANQDQVATSHGGLVYNLTIAGIDTLELRTKLKDCVADPRLGFDSDDVLESIQDGTLNLESLNPVKATVLINKIKHLPFKVSWESLQTIKAVIAVFVLTFFSTFAWARGWGQHEVNLKAYAGKIRGVEEEIQGLIQQKNQNRNPDVREELLKEIVKKNQERLKLYKEYKKEQEHIRFEHPAKGDKSERKYRRVKLKSLDDLEDELGVDGQLSRIKQKVLSNLKSEKKMSKKGQKAAPKKPKAPSMPQKPGQQPKLPTSLPEKDHGG